MEVSQGFDSGAIEVIACGDSSAELAIRHDVTASGEPSEFLQWFHFRVSGAENNGAELRIVNAGATTYPDGWRDYRAVASWNLRDWERIPNTYDGQVLTISLPPAPARRISLISSRIRGNVISRCWQTASHAARDCDGSAPAFKDMTSMHLLSAMAGGRYGSSPGSIRAKPWPNGLSVDCCSVCSTKPMSRRVRYAAPQPFTSFRT